MKKKIKQLIKEYVKEYAQQDEVRIDWKEPLVKFAAADDNMFLELKEIVSSTHALPEDFLADAKTVISYFLPFAKEVVESNAAGEYSSKKWAQAYMETNELIFELNKYIKQELEKLDYESTIIPATHNFDKERLISDWSHRHVAYIAGLGKFGINNMLITDKGCAGRIGSIVTDLKLAPSPRTDEEYCLYKSQGICKKCVERCVNDALQVDSFEGDKCQEMLAENDELYSELDLTDVCGKCSVNLPGSFTNPVNIGSD